MGQVVQVPVIIIVYWQLTIKCDNIESLPKYSAFTVYFSWPDPTAPPNWQFLGYISNAKPSAIFKISTLKKNHEFENSNLGIFGVGKISHVAQIGVSVEPIGAIEQQAATVTEATSISFLEFVQKMLTSFLNYVSSFSVTQSQMTPNPTENFVPLSAIQGWYETFERRLQQNPNFWKAWFLETKKLTLDSSLPFCIVMQLQFSARIRKMRHIMRINWNFLYSHWKTIS